MTSEQKVKRVYPKACLSGCSTSFGFTWRVYSRPISEVGGKLIELAVVHSRRKSWAWAEAWRNIEAQRTKREEGQ